MDKDFLPITLYTVKQAITGTWTTVVEANTQTPFEGIDVAGFNTMISDVRLSIPVPPLDTTPQIHHEVAVTAQLRVNNSPILGANVRAQLVTPDGKITAVILYDDGRHNDGAANDGLYGYLFTATIPGVYSAIINASGTNGDNQFSRSRLWAIPVEGTVISLPFIQH